MKAGRGKAKGGAFERQIAKELSRWLTQGADSTQLIRSVLSGGWARGQQAGEGWRHVGDLAPNGPVGESFRRRYAVECKHRKAIDLFGLWTRAADSGTLIGWWNKLVRDSEAAGVEPMLIFRANCMPIMVGMRSSAPSTPVGAIFPWVGLRIFRFDALVKCPAEMFLSLDV